MFKQLLNHIIFPRLYFAAISAAKTLSFSTGGNTIAQEQEKRKCLSLRAARRVITQPKVVNADNITTFLAQAQYDNLDNFGILYIKDLNKVLILPILGKNKGKYIPVHGGLGIVDWVLEHYGARCDTISIVSIRKHKSKYLADNAYTIPIDNITDNNIINISDIRICDLLTESKKSKRNIAFTLIKQSDKIVAVSRPAFSNGKKQQISAKSHVVDLFSQEEILSFGKAKYLSVNITLKGDIYTI